MSKVHEGWTHAHAHHPLHHDARDNAGLPPARDQGEGAKHVDANGHESKYEEAHKSHAQKIHAAVTPEEKQALAEQFAKEVFAKQAAVDPGSRQWKAGTSTPKEHK